MKLRELHEAATPGPWNGSDPMRIQHQGVAGPIMSYLTGNRSTTEGMTVSLGSERLADHEFVRYLRNHATDIIELIEAAKALHDDNADYLRINNLGGYDNHNMKRIRSALAKFDD